MATPWSELPCEIRQVPVVAGLSERASDRDYRRPGQSVLLPDVAETWPALERWFDAAHLVERVGADTRVWLRQALDAERHYEEEYVERSFGEFLSGLDDRENADYLTQGLVVAPEGLTRIVGRGTFPALLDALAPDCPVPTLIPADRLAEGVAWIGRGGPVTPLHFDEAENLNVLVRGTKEWLLFPPNEGTNLLEPGRDGRGSILGSVESLVVDGEWIGGPVRTAYWCRTEPGHTLFVPTGWIHQVWSGEELSAGVNFWYWDHTRPRQWWRALRSLGVRRMGYFKPLKRAVFESLVLAAIVGRLLAYPFRRNRIAPPAAGPTTYQR